jgi:hypothetical protein
LGKENLWLSVIYKIKQKLREEFQKIWGHTGITCMEGLP